MTQGNSTDIFERLASKGYTALMNDGYDLLVRTTINAAGMKAEGNNPSNINFTSSLVGTALNDLDKVLYSAALVHFQPLVIAESIGALPFSFFELSEDAKNRGNDYAAQVLTEELSAYMGAFGYHLDSVFNTLGNDPEIVNNGIDRMEPIIIMRGLSALSDRELDSAKQFHETYKGRLEGRLVIPE